MAMFGLTINRTLLLVMSPRVRTAGASGWREVVPRSLEIVGLDR